MRACACVSACARARNSNAPPMLREGRANALPRSASAACLSSSMGAGGPWIAPEAQQPLNVAKS